MVSVDLKPGDLHDINIQLSGMGVDEGILYVNSDPGVLSVTADGKVTVAPSALHGNVGTVAAYDTTTAKATLIETFMFTVKDPSKVLPQAAVQAQAQVSIAKQVQPIGVADPGSTVTLRDSSGTVIATTTADSKGYFKFGRVADQNVIIDRTLGSQVQQTYVDLTCPSKAVASVEVKPVPGDLDPAGFGAGLYGAGKYGN